MGSSITIINDTQEDWMCKVYRDDKALKIAAIIGMILGSSLGIAAVWGAFTPYLLNIEGELLPVEEIRAQQFTQKIFRMQKQTLIKVSKRTEVFGNIGMALVGVGGFSVGLLRTLEDGLVRNNYIKIASNSKERWSGLHYFASRRATCVRAYRNNSTDVRVETVDRRYIYSGSPWRNNKDYSIAEWIVKNNGTSKSDIVSVEDTGIPIGEGKVSQRSIDPTRNQIVSKPVIPQWVASTPVITNAPVSIPLSPKAPAPVTSSTIAPASIRISTNTPNSIHSSTNTPASIISNTPTSIHLTPNAPTFIPGSLRHVV